MSVLGFRQLSQRETQLLLFAGVGLTDDHIARELSVAAGVVDRLWSGVHGKLGVNSSVSAVAGMSAIVSRLVCQFLRPADGSESYAGLLGQLPGLRLVVNRKLIVIACSHRAAAMLGIGPGVCLANRRSGNIRFLDAEGEPLPNAALPWVSALTSEFDVFNQELSIARGSSNERCAFDCHTIDDPVLGRVAMLELRTVSPLPEVAQSIDAAESSSNIGLV